MKNKYSLLKLIICIWILPMISNAEIEDEFTMINNQRTARAMVIDIIKEQKLAEETKNGTLESAENLGQKTRDAIEAENKDRLRQFSIIATKQGKTAEQVATEFAAQMGIDVNLKEIETVLRIHGSNTIGAKLAPKLVVGFLKSQGLTNVTIDTQGVETFIKFETPGKDSIGLVEIKAHGSSTAFYEADPLKKLGLAGGFCDLGMASRQIKEEESSRLKKLGHGDLTLLSSEYPIALDGVAVILNPKNKVSALSSQQIADVFSGKIKNWKQLGGEDLAINLYARDEQSGTWETFNTRVLEQFSYKLAEKNVKRFEDSSLLARAVGADPAGIGFCGLAYVDTSVKGLAVSSKEGLTAFQPTRLTVKTQDYPLSRILYFYLPSKSSTFSYDFVKFTMSNDGQKIVDEAGLIGQGLSSAKDITNADVYKENLIKDKNVPELYKNLIKNADRRDTQANIRFAVGSMEPDTNSTNNLNRLADFLAQAGNENKKVTLIGFTDNQGSNSANLELSKKRAAFIEDLLKAKGVRNIISDGLGEIMPVADNSSDKQRHSNRRVEIWLSK